ncbi:tetratricopeptide repeat protein [Bacillus atrophaeus]|uniref:tetratricopeptide repeat protein n=1 Tax=Bacillus atrophaeus TaxID=1452 RepID=UPI0028F6FC5C|nr:tetratricopeptide repeat protein [Bacillus atrophaeus]WNV80459.1 tetratricopeptide repeat protein [Bacillus atrophaeus]
MKQTHVSMHYSSQAYNIYKTHDLYSVRRIQCHFVIAGNYDDLESHEKALPHLEQALKGARLLESKNKRIYGQALFNIGNCYLKMGELTKAAKYMEKSILQFKKSNFNNLTQAYHDLALIYFLQHKQDQAIDCFRKGVRFACKFDDGLFKIMFEGLQALFIKKSVHFFKCFQQIRYIPRISLYGRVVLAAKFYTEIGQMDDSVICFKKMVHARKQIQRGDCLYEI